MGRLNKRDDVLDAAEALFCAQGFAATGISEITRAADVASMTLYNNFENKDALIVATLERRSQRLLATLRGAADKAGDDPKTRILAIFDAIGTWVTGELRKPSGFAGCMFMKASHEYLCPRKTARRIAVDHKRTIIALLQCETTRLDPTGAKELALSLHLLLDGAVIQAHILGDKKSVRRSKAMAKRLLDDL